jgi:4-hydroxyphenylacetate 3-monooxygenase
VTTGHSFRTFDWDGAIGIIDNLLATYDLSKELAALQKSNGQAARRI